MAIFTLRPHEDPIHITRSWSSQVAFTSPKATNKQINKQGHLARISFWSYVQGGQMGGGVGGWMEL